MIPSKDYVIHHASCLNQETGLPSLPDRSVDAIITDPPYSPHIHANIKNLTKNGSHDIDLKFDSINEDLQTLCATQFARICRGWIVIFSDIEGIAAWKHACAGAGLDVLGLGCWSKPNAMPQLTGDRPGAGWEAILIARVPHADRHWKGQSLLWRTKKISTKSKIEERFHLTQKPLSLMDEIVQASTEPDDIICDPFSGSATTGVAAKRHNRWYIGYEMDDNYVKRSRERLSSTGVSLDLFSLANGADTEE